MKLNAFQLVLNSGPVVQSVLVMLALASVISWAIIALKVYTLGKSRRNTARFLDFFWSQKNMESAYRRAKDMVLCPVAAMFSAGYMELLKATESAKSRSGIITSEDVDSILSSVDRALRGSASTQTTQLERRISFLATTGNAAPFVGLFGTVWGIMNSFLQIGKTGATNLAVVAPGIAEALIATAMGLVAAIPAVIGYNYSVSYIRMITRDMENFSNDFLNIIKRQVGTS